MTWKYTSPSINQLY